MSPPRLSAQWKRLPLEQLLGWLALACWLASWFLPVLADYPGWAAFRAAIAGPFRDPFPVGSEDAVPQVLSALSNVVFAVLWMHWIRKRITRPMLFFKVTLACLILNLYWPVQMLRAGETRALLAGYYVWLAAFALLCAVAVLNVASSRRTSRTPTAGTPA